jgi:hypothetical protein
LRARPDSGSETFPFQPSNTQAAIHELASGDHQRQEAETLRPLPEDFQEIRQNKDFGKEEVKFLIFKFYNF